MAPFLLICLIIISLTVNIENGRILRSAIAVLLKIGSEIATPILLSFPGRGSSASPRPTWTIRTALCV
jgi:hypothetical protein